MVIWILDLFEKSVIHFHFLAETFLGFFLFLVSGLFIVNFDMADVSDPKIQEAYLDVRSDKSETNWLLLDYENDRSDKLALTQTGSGGLDELSGLLDHSKASFGYARVSYSNDKESQREKFILIVWIGKDTKVMRRAKISVHSADVKSVFESVLHRGPCERTG